MASGENFGLVLTPAPLLLPKFPHGVWACRREGAWPGYGTQGWGCGWGPKMLTEASSRACSAGHLGREGAAWARLWPAPGVPPEVLGAGALWEQHWSCPVGVAAQRRPSTGTQGRGTAPHTLGAPSPTLRGLPSAQGQLGARGLRLLLREPGSDAGLLFGGCCCKI